MTSPDSGSRSGRVLELAEEFLDRYRAGERPALREYTDRHPDLASEIREVFPAMALMERIAIADDSLGGDPTGAGPAAAAPALEPLGDFRILREVGRGGMGVVYEAEQVSLGRHVALKVLPPQSLRDERTRRRFEREARAAAKLHHTNIVPVFGVGEAGATPYYAMQFIRGQGLDAVLEELKRLRAGGPVEPQPAPAAGTEASAADVARSLLTGRLDRRPADAGGTVTAVDAATPAPSESESTPEAGPSSSASGLSLPGGAVRGRSRRRTYWQGVARVGEQVAEALAYAHGQGVVHRDIKPSNLLLDAHGTVWVTDFGLAKADGQENLTHTGDVLGTLRYMPPEAFEGKADRRGDVYSLGLTLYEMLAFRPAFGERERGRLVRQVTTEPPPRLRKVNPEVPRDLETVVHKAIERDPAHRYSSADELADDLRRFLDDEPVRARRLSPPQRLARWARRNPVVAGLSAAVAALVCAVIAGLWTANTAAKTALGRETALRRDARAEAAAAEQAREASEAARKEADAARLRLGDELYASHMNLVQTAMQAGNTDRATALLDLERPRPGEPDRRGFEWHYWRRKANPERRVWWQPYLEPGSRGHAFSGDGRLTARGEATGQPDGLALVVREVETGRVRLRAPLELRDPADRTMLALKFSGDDRRVVAVWRTWRTTEGDTPAVADLGVWDLAGGDLLFRRSASLPRQGVRTVWCDVATDRAGDRVAWGLSILELNSATARHLASRSRVLADEVATGRRLLDRTTAEFEVMRGLTLTADGDRMAVVLTVTRGGDQLAPTSTSRVAAFDLPGGAERPPVALGDRLPTKFQLDPTGRRFAFPTVGAGKRWLPDLRVTEAETGRLVWSRESGVGAVISGVDFTPDGARLLACGPLGFQVLDATADRPPLFEVRLPFSERQFGVEWARLTRGGRRAVGFTDGLIKEWDVPDPAAPLGGAEFPDATSMAVSPDGGLAALIVSRPGGPAPALVVLDGATGREVCRAASVLHEPSPTSALFFSPDGSKVGLIERVALSYRVRGLSVWDARTGRPLVRLEADALTRGEALDLYWTASASFSPDGRRLALALTGIGPNAGTAPVLGGVTLETGVNSSRVGRVFLLDAERGEVVRTLGDDGTRPLNLARQPLFTPDGGSLVAATATDAAASVCVWDLRRGGPPRVLGLRGTAVPELLAVSGDGRRLVGVRQTLRRWVIESWDLRRPADPPRQVDWHGARVHSLSLSPDGARLAVASGQSLQTGGLTLWDAESFRELASWPMADRNPDDARFTPDGRRLLVTTSKSIGEVVPSLLVFDAEPLDPRLEAFALVQKLGAEEPLNARVVRAVREQAGYEPAVLREAERLASERPEFATALLLKVSLVPRLPVPFPAADVERWAEYTAEAARVAPGMPLAQTEYGRSLFALRRFGEARDAYARAVALDPKPAAPHAWLALCEARLGRLPESLASASNFLRSSRQGPQTAEVVALRDALASGLRAAFGPELEGKLGPEWEPAMPDGPDAFAR